MIGREQLTAVRAAIRAINKVGIAEEVYRQKLSEGQDLAETVLDAEARLGELRKTLIRATGRNQYSEQRDTDVTQLDATLAPTATKDTQRQQGNRLQTIAEHPEIVERVKAEAREKGELVTKSAVLAAIKAEKKEQSRKEREEAISEQEASAGKSIDIFTTDEKYRVIYADPPWQYDDKQNIDGLGGAEKHYHTMSLEEIEDIPMPVEDNAVLFLWTTSPMLEVSFDVIRSWGFKYKSSFIWDKVAHNMGHYNSVRHEFLLIATRGSCTPDVQKLFDSVQSIERTEHSRKPEEFRNIIDTLYTKGKKLEMFARVSVPGWDAWGNMI